MTAPLDRAEVTDELVRKSLVVSRKYGFDVPAEAHADIVEWLLAERDALRAENDRLEAENERLRAVADAAKAFVGAAFAPLVGQDLKTQGKAALKDLVERLAALDTQTADDGEAAPEQDRTHFHVDIVSNDWHNAKQVRVMTASLDGSYRFATEPHAPADCPFAGKGDEVPMQVIPVEPGEPLPAPPRRSRPISYTSVADQLGPAEGPPVFTSPTRQSSVRGGPLAPPGDAAVAARPHRPRFLDPTVCECGSLWPCPLAPVDDSGNVGMTPPDRVAYGETPKWRQEVGSAPPGDAGEEGNG